MNPERTVVITLRVMEPTPKATACRAATCAANIKMEKNGWVAEYKLPD